MSRQLPFLHTMVASVALLTATVSTTLAAPKGDPKPIDQRQPAPDVRGFAQAYERANEPEMIVVCGIVTGGPQAGERAIANFDPEADSDALRRRIEELLLEARVELIEQSSLDAVKQRELTLLAQQDEGQVIEALKTKFNADVAIRVEMQPRGRDAKYRVTVDTLSITRGRKIGTFSFDWKLGDNAETIKAYGDAVTRKVMEQFIKFYLPGDRGAADMRYTVLLVGVEDNRIIRDASREFEKIQGVSKVRVRGNTDAGGRKATTLEVQYAGAMFDLSVDLEETASKVLGLKVDGTDATAGTITLIASGTRPAPPVVEASPCEQLFDPNAARHELFKERYKTQGRPRVTILINREVFKGERQNQEHSDDFKFIGPAPGGTTHPLLVTATAENAIAEWFKKLDVRIVNADQVRQRVKQAAAKAGGVLKNDELLKLLKDDDVADIVILGRGGTVGAGAGVWYTFEATRMGGDNLGNTRWAAEIDGKNLAAIDEAFDALGHDVTCKLALDLMAEWKGNARLDVVVTGVRNAGAVYAIMDELKKGYDGIVEMEFGNVDGGKEGGIGRFTIEYNAGYESLARKVSQLADAPGSAFSVESSTREGLVLRSVSAEAAPAAPRKAAEVEPAEEPAAAPATEKPAQQSTLQRVLKRFGSGSSTAEKTKEPEASVEKEEPAEKSAAADEK